MRRLLIVHHSPTASLRRLTDAVVAGARDDEIEGVDVVVRPALETTAEDVLAADGYLLGSTANFGNMASRKHPRLNRRHARTVVRTLASHSQCSTVPKCR